MLAVDLRFPKPKPLRREFIELIWVTWRRKSRKRIKGEGTRVGFAFRGEKRLEKET